MVLTVWVWCQVGMGKAEMSVCLACRTDKGWRRTYRVLAKWLKTCRVFFVDLGWICLVLFQFESIQLLNFVLTAIFPPFEEWELTVPTRALQGMRPTRCLRLPSAPHALLSLTKPVCCFSLLLAPCWSLPGCATSQCSWQWLSRNIPWYKPACKIQRALGRTLGTLSPLVRDFWCGMVWNYVKFWKLFKITVMCKSSLF